VEEPTDLDSDLTAIGRHGDHLAYKRLFSEISPRLKSFLMKNGLMETAAEEVLQDTMLKVWRKAALYDSSKSSASTWIYTIARNVKIDRIRKEMRPEPDPDDPCYIQDSPETGERSMERKQDRQLIRQAMSLLPPEQMRIITMSFFEEKAHGEIAEELDIPLGTVKSRIRLAFGKIRTELEARK
jgi:RNA polymerase sigma-70 factor, ECF subfamily